MNRDLGLNHGAGKGDNDRTDDRTQYEKNLDAIKGFGKSDDRTGYTKVGPGRWRKVFGQRATKPLPAQD